jgi:hypothetical protein
MLRARYYIGLLPGQDAVLFESLRSEGDRFRAQFGKSIAANDRLSPSMMVAKESIMNYATRGIMNTKDPTRVDLDRSFEVGYWAIVLGVSELRLTALVSKVGNSVQDIRRELVKAA